MIALTLPIPGNAADFEKMSLEFALSKFPGRGDFYGRTGQEQHGVDSILRLSAGMDIGVQNKRYHKTDLTAKILQADLEAAHVIEPKLGRYVVTTTKQRDTHLQDWARSATLHGQSTVEIVFWESIAEWILADPNRKADYLSLDVVECAEIMTAQIPGRSAKELIAFAASAGAVGRNESLELVEARVLLRSGKAHLALERIQPAINQGTHEPAAWRIAAFAQLHLGDPNSSLLLLDRAALMGLRGGRFEIARASALIVLGQTDQATRVLSEAQATVHDDADHGALVGSWLSHCLEIENLSYVELAARVKPGDLVYPEVHVALANAAANEGNSARTAEHLAILEKSSEIDCCVPSLLRALAPIAAGERAAARAGGELSETTQRAAVGKATIQLEATIDDLRGAPGSGNRAVALALLARGQILLKCFDKADQAFIELIAVPGVCKGIRLLTSYATSFGRQAVIKALICSPEARSHPIVKLLRLEQQSVLAEEAEAQIEELFGSVSDSDEWLPFVLAAAVAQKPNMERWQVWLERAIRVLPNLSEAEPLILNLALIVAHGQVHPAVESVARQLEAYARIHRLSIGALAQLVALFRRYEQTDLHGLYGAALDRAIDAGEMPTQLHEQYLVIHETLARLGLSRAASCLEGWFAPGDDRRLVQGLRVALGWWQGDMSTCYRHLAVLCQTAQATPADILQMTVSALFCGKLSHARRLLRERELPKATTVEDNSTLARALLIVGLTQHREEVLSRFTSLPDLDGKAFTALMGEMTNRRGALNPDRVKVHTLTRLERLEDHTRQLLIWITPTGGESAPHVERAGVDEGWITPLMGQAIGATITIPRGFHAGNWRVMTIEPGSIALSLNALHKAKRIGLDEGGVDVIDVRDDPAETIRRLLKKDGLDRFKGEPEGPILVLAHILNITPFRFMDRFNSYRMAHGTSEEKILDIEVMSSTHSGFIIDPLSALILESNQLLDPVSRAAGKLYIAPQSRITLGQWWHDQRASRQAVGHAGLSMDGRLIVQEFDAAYRKRFADFWRRLSRSEGVQLHVFSEPFTDSVGAQIAPLIELFGVSMACSCAYAKAFNRPIVSIDGNLVNMLRAFKVPAISLPGIISYGVAQGRITWRESAAIKSSLRHAGWTFVGASTRELIALLNANDDTRVSDIHGLLMDASQADVKSAVRVIVKALNHVGPKVHPIGDQDAATVLFKKLPPVPNKSRKESASHVPDARRAWYKDAYWAWRRGKI